MAWLARLICSFIMFSVLVLTADSFASGASGRNSTTPIDSDEAALKTLKDLYEDHKNKIDVNMSNAFLITAVKESSEKRIDLILNPPKTKTLFSPQRTNVKPSMQSVKELIISSAPRNCPKKIIEKLVGYLRASYAYDAEVLNSILKRSVILGDSDLFKQVLEQEKANISGTERDRVGIRRVVVTQKGINDAFFTACQAFRVDSLGPDFINIFLTGSHGFKASPEAVFTAIAEELKLPKSHILEKLLLPEQFENTYVKLSKSPETLESFKKFVVFIQSKQRLLSDNAKKDAFLGALRANMGALELIINNPLLSPSQEILDEVFLIAAVLPNEKAGFLMLLNSSKINVSGLVDALVDLSNTLLHSKDKVVPDHAIKSSIRESCKEILKKLISMPELEKEDMDSMLLACIYMNEAADFNSVLNHQKYKIDQDTINLALAEAVRAKSIELLSIILNNEKLKPNQDAAGKALKILTRMYEKNPISPEELAILDQMLEKIMNAQVKPKQDDQNKAFLRLCSLEGRDKPLLLFLKAFENEKYQIDQSNISVVIINAIKSKNIELLGIILNNEKTKPNKEAVSNALKTLMDMYEKPSIPPEELAILDRMLENIMGAQVKPSQEEQNNAFSRLCNIEGKEKLLLLFIPSQEGLDLAFKNAKTESVYKVIHTFVNAQEYKEKAAGAGKKLITAPTGSVLGEVLVNLADNFYKSTRTSSAKIQYITINFSKELTKEKLAEAKGKISLKEFKGKVEAEKDPKKYKVSRRRLKEFEAHFDASKKATIEAVAKEIETKETEEAQAEKSTGTKPAGTASAADKASTSASGGKWTADQCNTNCSATSCAADENKFAECSDKCKASPMQILRCSAAGYKKWCMEPDMSANKKGKSCERGSYALSAQIFRLMSMPVKSTATDDEKKAASTATTGRFKLTGKWLSDLTEEDLKKDEVKAIMSREAKAYRKVSSIDDENDAGAQSAGSTASGDKPETTKPAGKTSTDKASATTPGGKWTADQCNTNCSATSCAATEEKFAECSDKCKASPMQIVRCSAAGYKKWCMLEDMSANKKGKSCERGSYALSAQIFRLMSMPVKSTATPEQKQLASTATNGRFKPTGKWLSDLKKEDLKKDEVKAIMSREAQAYRKVAAIDDENDAGAQPTGSAANSDTPESTKPAGKTTAADKSSATTSGGKWTAEQCNTNCSATSCAADENKFAECSDKCKASPMQIVRCSAAGYKKWCMEPDMSANKKGKSCERGSYALSAQIFRLMSMPVKSTATPEQKQLASTATNGRFKPTGKWLSDLKEEDLKKDEVKAIMSREAQAYRKVAAIDDENDAGAQPTGSTASSDKPETTKPAGKTTTADKASDKASTGGKWTAEQCNTNCSATSCAATEEKFAECSDKCKASPMQIVRCSAAGYKKWCMEPDMSANKKGKSCERGSYALSAQIFRLMSMPVKSTATPEQKQAASTATSGRFKLTGKWLSDLTEEDLKKDEVKAIMSREAKAYRKVAAIDDENG